MNNDAIRILQIFTSIWWHYHYIWVLNVVYYLWIVDLDKTLKEDTLSGGL